MTKRLSWGKAVTRHDDTRALRLLTVWCIACLAGLVLLASASPALAVESKFGVTHLYNAAHSLTGGCAVSAEDPVPDPPCNEEPVGDLPPEGQLVEPTGVATDAYGDQYVVNYPVDPKSGKPTPTIDIFSSEGRYIGGFNVRDNFVEGFSTEFGSNGVQNIAVDSTGHLYASVITPRSLVIRYDPTAYKPQTHEVEYGSPPVLVHEGAHPGIAVNPGNDHLYVNQRSYVEEYGPPTDGVPNELLTAAIGQGVLRFGFGIFTDIAVDRKHNRMYVTDEPQSTEHSSARIDAFSLSPPYELLGQFDGSTTPAKKFDGVGVGFSLAVDEGSGDLFVSYNHRVYELEADGTYVATLPGPGEPKLAGTFSQVELAYDNSALSPDRGYLYVPSGEAVGHLFAYESILALPPEVESISVGGIGEEEAVLHAIVNPEGEASHYVFEYTTQADFEANGFENAQVAGEGEIAQSGEGIPLYAAISGLSPGTAYRFRVRAENNCKPGGCQDEAQSSFTTFAPYAQSGACANQALRVGASALLPDCRAFELVTPPDTGGRSPTAGEGTKEYWTGSPDGSSAAFIGTGGAFPGQDAPGGFSGDPYVSRRAAAGWVTEATGLLGRHVPAQSPHNFSPDHGFTVVTTSASHQVEGELSELGAVYIRYPDRSLHLLGEGSIAETGEVGLPYISSGGSHIIFSTRTQLEPDAPATGTMTIYDRPGGGATRVVSLLPGELTPSTDAEYEGASADGSTVAFKLGAGGPLYLRLDNAQTVEGGPPGATFAGLSEEGRYLFYLSGGNLYRYDTLEGATAAFTESGDALPAYVSADGSSAYFVSTAVLTPEAGPGGATAAGGQENLYLAREGEVRFLATVTEADVKGEFVASLGGFVHGFSEWLRGVGHSGLLPLRASADGGALLFESRADLTDFKSGGRAQVYRYDAGQNTLTCLSCDPTGKAPASDASLLTPNELPSSPLGAPTNLGSIVPNLSRDGQRAFFQSDERLVPTDEDGRKDVYEWEAQGKGSCAEPGGCLFLVSSGQSSQNDYLYGASESGDDVFIHTSDLLNGEDAEEAGSIYDARVEGGFPPRQAAAGECQGEACQPAAVAPDDPTPASSVFRGAGNVKSEPRPRCPKGKKIARRGGKRRCLPRHHKKQNNHKRAKAERRAGR